MEKSIEGYLVDTGIDISDIGIKEHINRKAEGTYAKIPFSRVDKLRCRGRHLIATLWILSCMDETCKRKSPWFYVDPYIVEDYNTPQKDWYRCIKQLVNMGIIQVKPRAGHHGRNLYCFIDKLLS